MGRMIPYTLVQFFSQPSEHALHRNRQRSSMSQIHLHLELVWYHANGERLASTNVEPSSYVTKWQQPRLQVGIVMHANETWRG
jgi:hypothetical protein